MFKYLQKITPHKYIYTHLHPSLPKIKIPPTGHDIHNPGRLEVQV